MAKIFPDRPPQSIIDDRLRSAELKVFKVLSTLPNVYRVYYSMHWQNYYPDKGVNEGEADFVIVHPGMGILVLEVKGGAIQYNADRGQWYSQSRDGKVHAIKDPVQQGRDNHYEIMEKIKKIPNWPNRPLNIWHAVCFPDVAIQKGQFFKPDLPREVIIDSQDLSDISTSIDRVFKHCFGAKISYGAPGQERMPLIEGLLANSFEIRSPLNVELEKEDEKLIELTEQQYRTLSLLGDRKRAAIAGCAGSGKTMLAVHKAQQFADLGLKVLLVCFNTALADDLKLRLQDTIEVYTFHALCLQAAPHVDRGVSSSDRDQKYYDEVLPEALLEAAKEIGRIYDAIIVDEGQDFRENYWIAMESLLKEGGYLFIFFDNNQNLFGGLKDLSGLISEPPFSLNQNCRNTKSIHELVAKFHSNPLSLVCYSPEGRRPEIIEYDGAADHLRQLQRVVARLTGEGHVDNSDIVILTPLGEQTSSLKPGTKLGTYTLTFHPPNHISQLQATSVYKFKGLERRVVILTELDDRPAVNREMIMYVACSRARTELIILADKAVSQQIKDRIKSEP